MRPLCVLLMALAPAALAAEQAPEQALSGDAITALLPTIVAVGDNTRQTFGASGSTTYTDHGRDSLGRWWVEGDAYCSSWPPSNATACYAVLIQTRADGPDLLIWIGDSGRRTINEIQSKE